MAKMTKVDHTESMEPTRRPSLLIPYPGADTGGRFQDIFVYLRPEANGMDVESTMLRAVRQSPAYKNELFLVYLVNIPGDFMVANHVIEEHYALKLHFAVLGGRAFTPYMRALFERVFEVDFRSARVVGSFEALGLLGLSPDELFRLWVGPGDYCIIHGQTIKRHRGLFIVNYDLPALVHRNSAGTDIAAMIFRTSLRYERFTPLVRSIERSLIDSGLLREGTPLSYVFHYSKGPFEQLLDGVGYLYDIGGRHVPIEELTFCRWLVGRGYDVSTVRGLVDHPIVRLADEEAYLFSMTAGDSFEEAYAKISRITAQFLIPPAAAVPP